MSNELARITAQRNRLSEYLHGMMDDLRSAAEFDAELTDSQRGELLRQANEINELLADKGQGERVDG